MRAFQLIREARQTLHVRRQLADKASLESLVLVLVIILPALYAGLSVHGSGVVIAVYFLGWSFRLLWQRYPTLPRRPEAELVAHPRGVVLMADLLQWLPMLVLMAAALVTAHLWRDIDLTQVHLVIHFTGLILIMLAPFQVALLITWVAFELRQKGGEGRFTYSAFGALAITVALWIDWLLLGNLTASEAILPYGFVPILITMGALIPWLPPLVRFMARARFGCSPHELWQTMLTALIGMVGVNAVVIGLCSTGFVAGEGVPVGRRVILYCCSVAGLIVVLSRLLWLLPRIDVGTESVDSASRASTKTAPRAAAGAPGGNAAMAFHRSHASVPARGGGGIWRVGGVLLAHALSFSSHRRWPLLLALTGMAAVACIVGLWAAKLLTLALFAYTAKSMFIILFVTLAFVGILFFVPAPLGVTSSRRLYVQGLDYQVQARHTMRCGLFFGALPATLGLFYGLGPWTGDYLSHRAALVLLSITVLLLRSTAVRIASPRDAAWSLGAPSWADSLILLAIVAALLPAPFSLTLAIISLVIAIYVVWQRFAGPDHAAAWAKRAADDA